MMPAHRRISAILLAFCLITPTLAAEVVSETLIFLQAPGDEGGQIELTYNWDQKEPYTGGRNFGHLAFAVDDIYALCQRLMDAGVTINRPPRSTSPSSYQPDSVPLH